MKTPHLFLLFLTPLAPAAVSPEWVIETPLEFIASGRFQTPSTGSDLIVVDKANGLARVGLKSGGNLLWSEQATGMSSLTGFTVLRDGPQDKIACSSSTWNAVQLIAIGGTPQTLTSPVIGPHGLVRLSTGHAGGSVSDDILTLSGLGDAPNPLQIGGLSQVGALNFATPAYALPVNAQFLPLSSATAIPVLVSSRNNSLRVDRMNRLGFISGSFDVTGPHAAGLHWAAAPSELFSIAKDSLTLEQHDITSGPDAPGFTVPTGVALTTPYLLPEAVLSLDTIPFVDPAYPALRCLVAVRYASAPGQVRLYRLLNTPAPTATELMTMEVPAGESFAGLVSIAGGEFILLSGPGGRVSSWNHFAQPAPGQLPAVVASGTLPALKKRAANPNVFIFNQDPFITDQALLTANENHLSWTTIANSVSQGETDRGVSEGLGLPTPISVNAGAGVAIGNQTLPAVSIASFGPLGANARSPITFIPSPGTYGVLVPDYVDGPEKLFPISLYSSPGEEIQFRLTGSAQWSVFNPAQPPAVSNSGGTITAYARNTSTGVSSPIVTGTYFFSGLPAVVPATPTDANSNGLSNAWERAFGITDPNSDTDGDGFNAITEHNYGSDPLDPASRPAGGPEPVATLSITVQSGNLILDWPDGLVGYLFEYSPDLNNWFVQDPQPIVSTWTEAVPAPGTRKFFRLRRP